MSRSGEPQEGPAFDRGDALYGAGTLLTAGGVGWATAPGWGVATGGLLLIVGYLLHYVAALAAPRKGGEQ